MEQPSNGGCWFWLILFALIGFLTVGAALVAIIKLAVVIITVLAPIMLWGALFLVAAWLFSLPFRGHS